MPTLLCNRFCNQEFNAESSLQFPHYRPLCQCFPTTGATGADVLAPKQVKLLPERLTTQHDSQPQSDSNLES